MVFRMHCTHLLFHSWINHGHVGCVCGFQLTVLISEGDTQNSNNVAYPRYCHLWVILWKDQLTSVWSWKGQLNCFCWKEARGIRQLIKQSNWLMILQGLSILITCYMYISVTEVELKAEGWFLPLCSKAGAARWCRAIFTRPWASRQGKGVAVV